MPSHLEQLTELAQKQINKGIKKYGQIVADNPGDAIYWINHALEEKVDEIFYLMRLRDELQRGYKPMGMEDKDGIHD